MAEQTANIFALASGAIASVSLLVGGIGIMNIMFASVMERIKEIGTRLAIGAKKADIVAQFLAESVLISVTGGFNWRYSGNSTIQTDYPFCRDSYHSELFVGTHSIWGIGSSGGNFRAIARQKSRRERSH